MATSVDAANKDRSLEAGRRLRSRFDFAAHRRRECLRKAKREAKSDRRNFLMLIGTAGAAASVLPFGGTASAIEMQSHPTNTTISRAAIKRQLRSAKAS